MKIEPYKTRRITVIILIILVLALAGALYWKEVESSKTIALLMDSLKRNESFVPTIQSNVPEVIVTVLISMISIIVSSFIALLVIEKRNRNEIYSEAVDDWLQGKEIHAVIEGNNKIEENMNLKNAILPDTILDRVLAKIINPDTHYYYDSLDIEITCTIENGMIVKNIHKTVIIKSYQDEYLFSPKNNRFTVVKSLGPMCVNKPIDNVRVQLNKNKRLYSYCNQKKSDDNSAIKAGYTNIIEYYLKDELKIYSEKSTELMIDYKTYTLLDDTIYSFRLPCACKHTRIKMTLKNMDDYTIKGMAFGFVDDASGSDTSESNQEITMIFDNWVFKRDGFCFVLDKKRK